MQEILKGTQPSNNPSNNLHQMNGNLEDQNIQINSKQNPQNHYNNNIHPLQSENVLQYEVVQDHKHQFHADSQERGSFVCLKCQSNQIPFSDKIITQQSPIEEENTQIKQVNEQAYENQNNSVKSLPQIVLTDQIFPLKPPLAYGQSIDQIRYAERLRKTQQKQDQLYLISAQQKQSYSKQKDRLIQRYENQTPQTKFESQVALSQLIQKKQPLGKIVTQLEMNNPEIRKQLKHFLDQQVKEKNMIKVQERMKQRTHQIEIQELNDLYLQQLEEMKAQRKGLQSEYKTYLELQKGIQNTAHQFTNDNSLERLPFQALQSAPVEINLQQESSMPVLQGSPTQSTSMNVNFQVQDAGYPYRYDQSNNFNIITNTPFNQDTLKQLPPRPSILRGPNTRAYTNQMAIRENYYIGPVASQNPLYNCQPLTSMTPLNQIRQAQFQTYDGRTLNNTFGRVNQSPNQAAGLAKGTGYLHSTVDPVFQAQQSSSLQVPNTFEKRGGYFSNLAARNMV